MKISLLHTLLLIIITTSSVLGVKTCFNSTTTNESICYDIDSNLFPQNVNLWNGLNDKYNLNIKSSDSDESFIKEFFDLNKVDVTKLEDSTVFEFQSYEDFYNFLQQQNAIGNVSLFTQKDLNRVEREKTISLSGVVINWNQVVLTVVLEFFKIIIDLVIIIGSIYAFFRLIPYSLKKSKYLIYKIISRGFK